MTIPAQPTTTWRNRIVGTADVAPAELIPNPANWRSHPSEQQQAMSGALSRVGWVAQVLVNRTTGHAVDGHLRVELARTRGEPTVPVVYAAQFRRSPRRASLDRETVSGLVLARPSGHSASSRLTAARIFRRQRRVEGLTVKSGREAAPRSGDRRPEAGAP